jgi:hypothetical protein
MFTLPLLEARGPQRAPQWSTNPSSRPFAIDADPEHPQLARSSSLPRLPRSPPSLHPKADPPPSRCAQASAWLASSASHPAGAAAQGFNGLRQAVTFCLQFRKNAVNWHGGNYSGSGRTTQALMLSWHFSAEHQPCMSFHPFSKAMSDREFSGEVMLRANARSSHGVHSFWRPSLPQHDMFRPAWISSGSATVPQCNLMRPAN